MINNISGQAAVTSTSNNAPQKKEKNNMSSQSTSSNTSAQNTGLGNSAASGSNMAAAANTTASNSMQQNSAIFLSQSTSTNTSAAANTSTSAGQAQGNNPDNVDYQKEALTKLISDLRKDYIERNHYIDENTQISVLQIVNTETDHVIGQYPSDLYLSLLTKVRESQKQLVNQTI